jgi:hypothetical protein
MAMLVHHYNFQHSVEQLPAELHFSLSSLKRVQEDGGLRPTQAKS